MTRIICLSLLLSFGWLNYASAQSIPALSFEIKKPQKLENKKLGSEKGVDKKFTVVRRFVQNTFTKYNWHFNANEKLNEIIDRAKDSHKDDYTQLLSFYNYSPAETVRDSMELDSVIYKANAGILLHDLRNDWVDNLYMLMGRAYYFRQVFDTAYLNFQYINYAFSPKEKDGYDKPIGSNSNEGGNAFSISTKESDNVAKKILSRPPSRNESFIWLIRTYLALEEYPEAAGMIETLKADPLFPDRLKTQLHEMQALWFYQQNNYDSAAFYLEKALVNAASREERARWEYLVAQLYERSRKPDNAKEYYDNSVKHTLNPVLEVYARLNSIRQNKGTDEKAIQLNIDELLKMVRKDRYTNYRDIIYYSIAQMELERNNTGAAKFYLLKSTRADIEKSADPNQKSRSFLQLGDLAFAEASYSDAKNYYDSVQNQELVSNPEAFAKRKEVLSRIAASSNIIYRQDSLQRIAAMPEAERDPYIKKLVKKLRKEQGLKEDEPVISNNPINPNTTPTDLFDNSAKGDWYFYNTSLKSKGYTEFKGKWGNRPNADNWRRLSAINQAMQKKQAGDDSKNQGKNQATDDGTNEISYDALLKKLPLTPEKLKESNDSVENAQIELGKALMEGLEDYAAAIKVFETFNERFGYSEQRPEVLTNLYYCYQKTGDTQKADAVKRELQERYAGTAAEQKITNPTSASAGNKLTADMTARYETIYSLFIEGKFPEALAEKKIADSLYANNYWTPQLLYIQSIYYIRQRQDDSAKASLQDIINLYPSSLLATKAQTMIEVLNRRKDIEEYLTNLKVEKPADSISNPNDTTAGNKPGVTSGNKVDSSGVVGKPPVTARPVQPGVRKDSIQTKPVAPPKVVFALDAAAPHFVAIIMDKVDGVFINEAKNAFNRYNKQNYYNKVIDITTEAISDTIRVVLMNSFENAETAIAYIEKVRKVTATEIIPWLSAAKYSFGIITSANLELLKNSKDILEYRKFLAQSFPGKLN